MHELAVTQEIVEILRERAGKRKVRRVVIEIGKLSLILPDAVRFCFDLCAEGTPAEGAQLEILEPAGRARCRDCGGEVALEQPFGRCACGSTDLDWISGEELKVKEMEVL
jgi:hydrogenase nickel incorporation protein HypA/HybF